MNLGRSGCDFVDRMKFSKLLDIADMEISNKIMPMHNTIGKKYDPFDMGRAMCMKSTPQRSGHDYGAAVQRL